MNNKTRALLQGVGSLLNLRGSPPFGMSDNSNDDAVALKKDWNNIVSLPDGGSICSNSKLPK